MKKIAIGHDTVYEDTAHLVLDITDEPIMLHFNRAIDDLLISSPDGDVLIAWNLGHDTEWSDDNCLPIAQKDNLKEIGGIKTSLLALKAKEKGKTLKVYVTIQRN
jgi:hypothetical protein